MLVRSDSLSGYKDGKGRIIVVYDLIKEIDQGEVI